MKKLLLSAVLSFTAIALNAQTYPFQDESLSPEQRAADLVSRLTLDEKIDQVGHKTAAVSRLGLQGYNYWS